MSYDTSLVIDTGGRWPATVQVVGNCTYNVGPMFFEALGCSFSDLDGQRAGDVLGRVQQAVKRMREEPDLFRAMNSANGWGRYEDALVYLVQLARACEQHPKALIQVS